MHRPLCLRGLWTFICSDVHFFHHDNIYKYSVNPHDIVHLANRLMHKSAYNSFMKENTRSLFIGAYLRFLELTSAVEALPGMDFFDPNHKALFEAILLSWSQGRAMTVREAIGRAELGSPATLHKRLVRLRQAELVAVEFIAGDRRSKLLVPTEKGLDYVSKFGSQLAQLSLAPVSQTD